MAKSLIKMRLFTIYCFLICSTNGLFSQSEIRKDCDYFLVNDSIDDSEKEIFPFILNNKIAFTEYDLVVKYYGKGPKIVHYQISDSLLTVFEYSFAIDKPVKLKFKKSLNGLLSVNKDSIIGSYLIYQCCQNNQGQFIREIYFFNKGILKSTLKVDLKSWSLKTLPAFTEIILLKNLVVECEDLFY